MLGKNIIRKSVTTATLVAVWCVYSMVAYALPVDVSGEITVTGQVTVNGKAAVSGATIFSDSTITTAAGSSAVVSLGKLGRVEVQPDSTMTLRFSDGSIVATLDQGRVRVSSSAGIATTVATKHGTAIGDSSQANNFVVEAECSHTHLDTTSGVATLRDGSDDKRVAAGTTAVAGNLTQAGCKPCLRPDSAPSPNFAGSPLLLLLAAGAAGLGIWLATRDDDSDLGGGGTVVSPVR